MLVVSEGEEGVVVLHIPIGPLKTSSGWSRYRDTNPVSTIPLVDVITTAPSGPACVTLKR